MPKILDDCVKQVKQDFQNRGYNPDDAEQIAWAVCRTALKDELENNNHIEEGKSEV